MTTTQPTEWQKAFRQWQAFAQNVNARTKRLQSSHHEKGWKIAVEAGIGRCLCCVHNASIDDDLEGWCYRNPERLKAAKLANHILSDWTISQLGERIVNRAWLKLNGGAK